MPAPYRKLIVAIALCGIFTLGIWPAFHSPAIPMDEGMVLVYPEMELALFCRRPPRRHCPLRALRFWTSVDRLFVTALSVDGALRKIKIYRRHCARAISVDLDNAYDCDDDDFSQLFCIPGLQTESRPPPGDFSRRVADAVPALSPNRR